MKWSTILACFSHMCSFKGLTLRKFAFDVCVYMCVLCLGKERFCGFTGEKGAYIYKKF